MTVRQTVVLTGAATAVLALCAAAPAMAAPQGAGSRAATSSSAAAPRVVTAHGCYGATLNVPRKAGPVTAAEVGMPATAAGFVARANAHHVRWLTTMTCRRGHAIERLRPLRRDSPAGQANTVYTSGNWSGYQLNNTAGYVQSGWTVPTAGPSAGGGAGYSSIWAGIGGGFNSGNGALIQAGTEQDYLGAGRTQYDAWWEVVGGSNPTPAEVIISNMPVAPGQELGDGAYYTPANGTSVQGVCNFAVNTCLSFSRTTSAPGNSTEWIVEAPYNGGILPLSNFGTVPLYNGCWAVAYPFTSSNPCKAITAGTPNAIDMTQNGVTVATPGPITSGSNFTVTYH